MTVCSADAKVDAGHEVVFEVRRLDGIVDGVHYEHPRPDGAGQCSGYVSVKPAWSDGWDMVSESPLTLSPSLACRVCGHHGFIRDGKWVPA
jgi:hypothetical protein